MPRMTQRAKSKVKTRKAPARRRKPVSKRRAVPRKASNWLHARARDVKNGHNVRGTIVGLLGGFAATLFVALWFSGGLGEAIHSTRTAAANALMAAGFRIEHIEVVGPTGNVMNRDDAAAIRQALAAEEGELVFSINLVQARRRIENLGWIREARIMRQLPNRLTVIVIEREPFALWQSEGRWRVIGANGSVIESARAENYPDLTLVVGPGAPEALQAFLGTMKQYPNIAARVYAYVRVSGRRWNLRLKNGADLMLPAEFEERTLDLFENEPKPSHLLDRSFKRIDARQWGRIYIRPGTSQPLLSEDEAERLS